MEWNGIPLLYTHTNLTEGPHTFIVFFFFSPFISHYFFPLLTSSRYGVAFGSRNLWLYSLSVEHTTRRSIILSPLFERFSLCSHLQPGVLYISQPPTSHTTVLYDRSIDF